MIDASHCRRIEDIQKYNRNTGCEKRRGKILNEA